MIRDKIHISHFQEGDRSKQYAFFEEVYNEYFERLFAYALVITKSETHAQDIVSDVFYNLLKAKTDLLSIKKLKSYLFTCVKNQAVRSLSQDLLRVQSDSYDQMVLSIDQIDPEELMVGKELDEFINETVERLPPQCALVFRLVKENQLKYHEVAEQLGISNNTVKYHLKLALKTLKSEMKSHFSEAKVIKWISRGSSVLFISQLLNNLG